MSPKIAAQTVSVHAICEALLRDLRRTIRFASRPQRVLKHNDTFAVFDDHGDIGVSPGGTDGLFYRDTRFLSRLQL